MNELLARIKYNCLCLVALDDSWDMGAELVGSVFPLGGFWVNDNGTFKTYAEVKQ